MGYISPGSVVSCIRLAKRISVSHQSNFHPVRQLRAIATCVHKWLSFDLPSFQRRCVFSRGNQ